MHIMYGMTYKDVCDTIRKGKGANTLSKVANSPAGQEFLEEVLSMVGNTKGLVSMLLESTTLQMYVDWLTALEGAKAANDYKAVHQMIKDIGLQPVLEGAKRDGGPKTIVINMQSKDATSVEQPTIVEASWELAKGDGDE